MVHLTATRATATIRTGGVRSRMLEQSRAMAQRVWIPQRASAVILVTASLTPHRQLQARASAAVLTERGNRSLLTPLSSIRAWTTALITAVAPAPH
jgi:hypothetical protein